MAADARTAAPGMGKCGGCGHAFHRDTCPRKGTSGCIPLLDPATGRQTGIACVRGRGPCPCPCAFGACHTCGAPVAGASPFPLGSAPEIDVGLHIMAESLSLSRPASSLHPLH